MKREKLKSKKHYLNSKKLKSSNGITLIALVVTIIVLLILAGVSINMVLGNNGIFKKAQDSKYTMEKAVLKDKLETLIVNWKADNIIDNSVTEERFWKDLVESGIINDTSEVVQTESNKQEADGTTKDSYEIETNDGYTVTIIVSVTQDGEKNISIDDIELSSSTAPKLKITEITSTETSITVKVEVSRLNDGKITYSYKEQGTESWTEFAKEVTNTTETVTTGIEANKMYDIKVYVANSGGNKTVTGEISTDKTAPQAATATFDKTEVGTGEKVTATVTLKDAGVGVDITKCKYVFKKSSEKITDESEFKNTITGLTGTTEATGTIELTPTEGGEWYLHILTVDKAGNKTITAITTKITVEGTFTYNETAETGTSYVGYYADLDGNGKIEEEKDGIIFADMVVDAGKSGTWNPANNTNTYATTGGAYTITTVNSNNAKSYKVSSEEYTKGKFGTAKVLKLDNTDTTNASKEDRFYVMALKDITSTETTNNYFTWYDAAYDSGISDYSTITSYTFGTGKANTETMIEKWNKGANGGYGAQNDRSGYLDVWGVVQTKNAEGWFVPSANEWAAFGDAFNITSSNYSSKFGLSNYYWSSSLCGTYDAYTANFPNGYMSDTTIDYGGSVRLCLTF